MRTSAHWHVVTVNACAHESICVLLAPHGYVVTKIRRLMKRCAAEQEILEREHGGTTRWVERSESRTGAITACTLYTHFVPEHGYEVTLMKRCSAVADIVGSWWS